MLWYVRASDTVYGFKAVGVSVDLASPLWRGREYVVRGSPYSMSCIVAMSNAVEGYNRPHGHYLDQNSPEQLQ